MSWVDSGGQSVKDHYAGHHPILFKVTDLEHYLKSICKNEENKKNNHVPFAGWHKKFGQSTTMANLKMCVGQ